MNLRSMRRAIWYEISNMIAHSVSSVGYNPYTDEHDFTWADDPKSDTTSLGSGSTQHLVPGGSLGRRCWVACGSPKTKPAQARFARAMYEVGERMTVFGGRPLKWSSPMWDDVREEIELG